MIIKRVLGTKWVITAILAIFLFIANCKHEPLINHIPGPVDTTGNGGGNADDTTICFERDILPIIVTNCAKAGCHDAITKEENRNYTSYSGIVTKEDIKAGFLCKVNSSWNSIQVKCRKQNMGI